MPEHPESEAFDQSYINVGSSLKTDTVKEIYSAFVANIQRTLSQFGVIVDVAYWSGFYGECRGQAIAQILQTPKGPQILDQPVLFAFMPLHKATGHQQTAIRGVTEEVFREELEKRKSSGSESEWMNTAWNHGKVILDRIQAAPHIAQGMRGIMESAILSAWTAFEVLAVDLWVAALNARPMSLGDKALRAPKPKTGEREINPVESAAKADLSAVNIDLLRQYKFDVGDKLGTIML